MTLAAALVLLATGAWFAAVLDRFFVARIAQRPTATRELFAQPLRHAAALLLQQQSETERPDRLNATLAPALYLGLAGVGLAVVPFAEGGAVSDTDVGIVWWGAIEALTIVAVFLHGWSANSLLPLLGAYRYVAIALPVMLLSMFVLIAVALPAQSLSVSAIVESQRASWNVVRQPLGLPLFLLLGLSLTLRGPFDYGDSSDLAGGTRSEISGASRLAWQLARLAMLVSFAAIASACFLGGYLGPLLPAPLWMLLKTAVLLVVLTGASHRFARFPPARMLGAVWLVLMPLAFVDLAIAGLQALQ